MNNSTIDTIVENIAEGLVSRDQRLATVESCTGGRVAMLLTDRPGSSQWFERGLVTYTNLAKQQLVGVSAQILQASGAVSGPCVAAMAEGLLQRAPVDWTLSVSGIAGPGGGTPAKPVGTVWFGWARRGAAAEVECRVFDGDRAAVREAAARHALLGLQRRLHSAPLPG